MEPRGLHSKSEKEKICMFNVIVSLTVHINNLQDDCLFFIFDDFHVYTQGASSATAQLLNIQNHLLSHCHNDDNKSNLRSKHVRS